MQVLRSSDPKLYEEAEKADGLVFLLIQVGQLMLKDGEDMIRDFAGKPILGFVWVASHHRSLWWEARFGSKGHAREARAISALSAICRLLYQGIGDGRPVMRCTTVSWLKKCQKTLKCGQFDWWPSHYGIPFKVTRLRLPVSGSIGTPDGYQGHISVY